MAGDVVPMRGLFPACSAALDEVLTPLHYAKLTAAALRRLGYGQAQRRTLNWRRQIEDVREKLLVARRFDAFYLGAPWCLAGKRSWFAQPGWTAPTDQAIVIPLAAALTEEVAFEALMRVDHMLQKQTTSPARRRRALAHGLTIEAAVRQYFSDHWPAFYRDPANQGRWTQPCDHDFRLEVAGYNWKMDVSGARARGSYGNPGGGKRPVHWHLLCRRVGACVHWEGVLHGTDFAATIALENALSPRALVVWLNCQQQHLPYAELLRAALAAAPARS
ncbi:MAG: hypothetical protein NT169_22435 [Chloroflexi bacterium]|nr:hypothetical protein [Chloroflexota bacterium]